MNNSKYLHNVTLETAGNKKPAFGGENGHNSNANSGQVSKYKYTDNYQKKRVDTTFKFDTKKTICPCGEHSNYTPLTSHEIGGKCWSCNKFFPPQTNYTRPNYTTPKRYTPNTSKAIQEQSKREHIYWNNEGDNYLFKVSIVKDENGKKYCYQSTWNGSLTWNEDGTLKAVGNWENGISTIEPTLFDSPVLIALQRATQQAVIDETIVYIVEGEKDVLTLQKHGLIATCNPMGAGKWKDYYSELLRGLNCVIIPDNDTKGFEHAELVYSKLQGIAKNVKIVILTDLMPDLPKKGDVTDFYNSGGVI